MLELNKSSNIPLYRQVMHQMIEKINQGTYAPATRLPSERQLARDLGVNRSTVVRAYDELYALAFVERREGSGTYVRLPENLKNLYAQSQTAQLLSTINQQNSDYTTYDDIKLYLQSHDEVIDTFTGELPSTLVPNLTLPPFHWQDFLQQPVESFGSESLRQGISSLMKKAYGYRPDVKELLLTAGGQQSLYLLLQTLLKPGDVVAIESPSFFRGLSILKAMSLKVIEIPVDDEGMVVEKLAEDWQHHSIRLVITNPNFQNPTGTTLTKKRRLALLKLCQKYRVPLIEDDVFGLLSFDTAQQVPLLKQMAPEMVIYLGSLSKILGQRVQLGWIDAPVGLLEEVVRLRDSAESQLSIFPQVLASHALNQPSFYNQLLMTKQQLQKQCVLLEEAFEEIGEDWKVFWPRGGYYVWLTYQGRVLTKEDWDVLLSFGVAVLPSYLIETSTQSCRMNFARIQVEELPTLIKAFRDTTRLWRKKKTRQ